MDNFNYKQYLVENQLGPYSKTNEEVDKFKVQDAYSDILDFITVIAKKLNDEDLYAVHERLKTFFNRIIESKEETINESHNDRISKVLEVLETTLRNTSTNVNILIADKVGLVSALREAIDLIEDLASDIEREEQSI